MELRQFVTMIRGMAEEVMDPREGPCQVRHQLEDSLTFAFLSSLYGGEHWEHMEDYGESNEEWLKDFLERPNGIPSYVTFQRVLSRIEPQELHLLLTELTKSLCVVAIDGKSLSGSFDE